MARIHLRALRTVEEEPISLSSKCAVCLLLISAALAVPLSSGPAHGSAPPDKQGARISLLIATGMPGGTYYRVGLGMASLWTTNLKSKGIRVSAAISEGSRENIEAIRIADADLILAENLFCSTAYHGTGGYKGRPLEELRAIASLWQDTVHILIRKDLVKTGTIKDLQGVILATGLPESGNRFTTELLLKTIPGGIKSVRMRSMSSLAGAEAVRKGTVQAFDLTGGIPVPLVTGLFSESSVALELLDIPDSSLEMLKREGWKDVSRVVIPAETYPGQAKPVRTVGSANVLATTASLNPEVVYELTRALFESLEYLATVHPACRNISAEKALMGMDIPLHRGAERYYRERNIEIPPHGLQ
ncbi:MAG: TAXI family TRAP transporter solute-binding subunit [Thermodesulfobacteriota bacterium]